MATLIAHVDMDCFFSACEEKRDPALKGRPVIVGAAGNRGVACTANYKAREFGVHSAMPITKAREACPEGVFLPVDFPLYALESRRVMDVLSRFDPGLYQVSIDEAYLDVTRLSGQFTSRDAMARAIRRAVLEETGLSCSVGVAECRVLAKIASDYRKPGGVTIVEDAKAFLSPLPIEKVPGVGRRSLPLYHEAGIGTVGDLLSWDRFRVIERFGTQGLYVLQLALGEISYGMPIAKDQKAFGRERTTHQDLTAREARTILLSLCRRLEEDLEGRYFRKITIKVRYADFTTITRDVTLPSYERGMRSISRNALRLFFSLPSDPRRIRLVGVRTSVLMEGQRTLREYLLRTADLAA